MKVKKGVKIAIGVLLFLGAVAIGIPLLLEAKMGTILRNKVNQNIEGHFDFTAAKLSLIRSFPNARISLEDVSLTTRAPFEGDTLFAAREAYLVMGIGELFKGEGEPIGIQQLHIDGADLRLEVDAEERVNYLIAKEDTTPQGPEDETTGFTLDLQEYAILNSRIRYMDRAGGLAFEMEEIQHRGSGDLSLAESRLQTQTEALVSFAMDSVAYLSRNYVELEALLSIDLETDTYRFLENTGKLNQMPLVVDGFVQLLEEGQEVDLTFRTPSSEFKNFLALVPEAYSQNLEGVSAQGQFVLEGMVKGLNSETRIPGFDIRMEASDAAFRYPNLPKGVQDIAFQARVVNTTGQVEDTYLELPSARFRIDQDAFSMNAIIRSLTGNPQVEAALKGTLNLAHISQAYPVDLAPGLSGLLRADITTAFDMASVEAGRYQDTRTSGTLQLTGANLKTDAFKDPLQIQEARLKFNPATAQLEDLTGTLGQSDFKLSGTLREYLGYALSDATLKGDFILESRQLVVSDFQTAPAADGGTASTSEGEAFQIPDNLDVTVRGKATTVQYDGLPLRNVQGNLVVRDARLLLEDVRSDMLDGVLALNGALASQEGRTVFEMDLGVDRFKIGEALEAMELFRNLAPIASLLEGRLNSKLHLSGALRPDFSLDLMRMSGNVVAEVLSSQLSGKKVPVVEALDSQFDFIDMNALDLKGLKTVLAFEEGRVSVRPFQFSYKDINVQVQGGHTFDQQLSYTATLAVPAKYLGPEVNRLITELQEPGLQEATIPVVVSIGGNYQSPAVQTDLKQAVTGLTSRLVEAQKQKLLATGKDKAQQLIGNILKGEPGKPTAQTDSTRAQLGNILTGVIGGKAADSTGTTRDSTTASTGGQVKQAARNILGGLLNKKKDTARVRKDSTQR